MHVVGDLEYHWLGTQKGYLVLPCDDLEGDEDDGDESTSGSEEEYDGGMSIITESIRKEREEARAASLGPGVEEWRSRVPPSLPDLRDCGG